ncbi:hypothetical protein B0T19DRAFT_422624 [Cercophora scortea]|uniref:Uncharacterized protein n=1 Tax=Cercophora scortea TaxID=314031 RepID=A0AAE0IML6_9PEZI|nr:hypothetical protein B0T19DRAFT_422624 [Cercophora scortea]
MRRLWVSGFGLERGRSAGPFGTGFIPPQPTPAIPGRIVRSSYGQGQWLSRSRGCDGCDCNCNRNRLTSWPTAVVCSLTCHLDGWCFFGGRDTPGRHLHCSQAYFCIPPVPVVTISGSERVCSIHSTVGSNEWQLVKPSSLGSRLGAVKSAGRELHNIGGREADR